VTDRLYLAAHNGLIVCLHDRDYQTALLHRSIGGTATAKPPVDPRLMADMSLKLSQPLLKPLPYFEGQPVPLREVLLKLQEREYGELRISIAERAYREQGKLAVLEKPILVPKYDKRRTLGQVLQDMLDQADSTFEVLDAVLIYPGRGLRAPQPPEKP
jgi:hypothetical protein